MNHDRTGTILVLPGVTSWGSKSAGVGYGWQSRPSKKDPSKKDVENRATQKEARGNNAQ